MKDLSIKLEYRNTSGNLAREFFVPCLSQAVRYDRAVGYFTSTGLAAAARGLASFVRNEGTMRLVASPLLNDKDVDDIEKGYRAREEVIAESLTREIEGITERELMDRVQNLSWLISSSRLQIKIAFKASHGGVPRKGIYHEKIGIFYDKEGNEIAFSGSPNETLGGLIDNYEDINVFASARDPERVALKKKHFEELWSNSAEGLEVIDFPDATKKRLESYKTDYLVDEDGRMVRIEEPPSFHLRPYQEDAIEAWRGNSFMGILAMATGTGKTPVALEAIRPLVEKGKLPIIVVPSDALLNQWNESVRRAYPQARTILCHGGYGSWLSSLQAAMMPAQGEGQDRPTFVISTMASACRDDFLRTVLNQGSPENLVVVVDEVHRVGARTYRSVLNVKSRYRLGLSATPIRQWDIEGSKAITDYFGGVIFEYSLNQAIRDGYLSPYDYRLMPVSMTVDELDEYTELSKSLAVRIQEITRKHPELAGLSMQAIITRLENLSDSEEYAKLTGILVTRRRIVRKAENKAPVLVSTLGKLREKTTLVYCDDFEQLDDIRTGLLSARVYPAEYTSRLDPSLRQELLAALKQRHVNLVLSCKCLDEGVDIPSCDAAVIAASSKSTREFIQRRGRLLRLHEGKDKSSIYDLVVIPVNRSGVRIHLDEVSRGILIAELQRAYLFARDALNRDDAMSDIQSLCDTFYIEMKDIERLDA